MRAWIATVKSWCPWSSEVIEIDNRQSAKAVSSSMIVNCDMGESYGPWTKGNDRGVMPLIDWANIACGGHAGDPETMALTLRLAREHNVKAGAHPGYPDKRNFGRIKQDIPVDSLIREVQAQIGALQAIAKAEGVRLNHVKPHGALYNAMMVDFGLLVRLAQGVAAVAPSLIFVLQATQDREAHVLALKNTGLNLVFEAFADRRYDASGRLKARSTEGSVLTAPDAIGRQTENLLQGFVETGKGRLQVQADTICVHGDNEAAVEGLRRVRALVDGFPGEQSAGEERQ